LELDPAFDTFQEALTDFRPKIPFRSVRSRPSLIPTPLAGREDRERVTLDKSNVLILGPTGSGKTLVAKTIADFLHTPFSISDVTGFTQAGYVGEDADVCIMRLLQASEFDVQKAQRGIVFLDEIDKIARRTDGGAHRDVSGEGVQQALLRMLEGTNVTLTIKGSGKRGPSQGGEQFTVDTSNILFVLAGAFVGLDKIVSSRIGGKGSIGFGAELQKDSRNAMTESDLLDLVEPQDLIKYGFIPEFVGRIPIVTNARALAVNDLSHVLTEPKNSIMKQFQEIFARNGVSNRHVRD
jgi:ATP-dependent Clp protease ATP-binding subunit ClpX